MDFCNQANIKMSIYHDKIYLLFITTATQKDRIFFNSFALKYNLLFSIPMTEYRWPTLC